MSALLRTKVSVMTVSVTYRTVSGLVLVATNGPTSKSVQDKLKPSYLLTAKLKLSQLSILKSKKRRQL